MRRHRLAFSLALLAATGGAAAEWYVDPAAGVDLPGCGDPAAPCRTLGYAASSSLAGDTIRLAAGDYVGGSNGEPDLWWVDGRTVIGAGADRTILRSPLADLALLIRPSAVEGVFLDAIAPGQTAVRANPATTSVRRCRVRGFEVGVHAGAFSDGPDVELGNDLVANRFEDNQIAYYVSVWELGEFPTVTDRSVLINNVFVRNQEVYRTAPEHFEMTFASRGPRVVANNLFLDNGSTFTWWCPVGQNGEFLNNVFAGGGGVGLREHGAGYFGRLTGNLFFNNLGGAYSRGGTTPPTGVLTVAEVNLLPNHHPSVPSLDADPALVDPGNGDFHLAVGSPAIDAGGNHALLVDDADGVARPIDGDGDGRARVDIGPYEAATRPQQLLRALIASLSPVSPPLAQVHPFDPANPLTPAVTRAFRSGFADTPPGAPLALYQLHPPAPRPLLLVRDPAAPGAVLLFQR